MIETPMPDEFAELREAMDRVANDEEHFSDIDCDHCDPDVNYTCEVCCLANNAANLLDHTKELLAAYDRVRAERDRLQTENAELVARNNLLRNHHFQSAFAALLKE